MAGWDVGRGDAPYAPGAGAPGPGVDPYAAAGDAAGPSSNFASPGGAGVHPGLHGLQLGPGADLGPLAPNLLGEEEEGRRRSPRPRPPSPTPISRAGFADGFQHTQTRC